MRFGNIKENELNAICGILRDKQPKNIFEIGTFDGSSARFLAERFPEATIFTLDLPPEETPSLPFFTDDLKTIRIGRERGIGNLCKDMPNVMQLYGDSRTFDFSPYYGKMDAVLIDGCHFYGYVEKDTENARKMIRNGGVIFWHDFDLIHPFVWLYLTICESNAKRINNTRMALLECEEVGCVART